MTENPLGYEKISKLLKNFAVPSIVASLVGSIYNIVDQIFIGQGVGYLGNAATNVAYPFSTICLAIALLVGIGSASRVSLCLGRKEPKAAAKAAGNGIVLMGIFGIIYLLVGETFLSLLLKAFGATTDVFPYAKQYASITLIGMPFLIVTNGILAAFSVPNEQSAFFEIAISYSKSQCLIYTQPAAIQNTVYCR